MPRIVMRHLPLDKNEKDKVHINNIAPLTLKLGLWKQGHSIHPKKRQILLNKATGQGPQHRTCIQKYSVDWELVGSHRNSSN